MIDRKRLSLFVVLALFLALNPVAAFACATCGCSELCPLVMVQDTDSPKNPKGFLSESIWGSIILKMAYQRDPEIQKLKRRSKGVNLMTGGIIAGAVCGTLAQNIISQATLNPPDPQFDSYLPGSIGVGMSGLVNIGLEGGILANWPIRHKIRARQAALQNRVEAILHHLEYSEAECPEAQTELSQIIGDRAAKDCIKLWHSSHATAALLPKEKEEPQASIEQNIPDLVSFTSGDAAGTQPTIY
jgi:hypothetical protein